jgi:chromosome segregation ATPase
MPAILLLLLLLSVLASSCALVGTDEAASEEAPAPQALGDGLREVAERRQAIDEEVDQALALLRRADEAVARARRAPLVDQGLEEGVEVRAELADLTPDDLRADLRELASRIDETRGVVAALRATLRDDEVWEHAYLDAQDAILRTVREHAAAGDALLQLVDRHRPTYDAALERLEAVAQERDELEDEAAAADEVDDLLADIREPLGLAQDELAEFRDRRRATGRQVNEATADAATVRDRRAGG